MKGNTHSMRQARNSISFSIVKKKEEGRRLLLRLHPDVTAALGPPDENQFRVTVEGTLTTGISITPSAEARGWQHTYTLEFRKRRWMLTLPEAYTGDIKGFTIQPHGLAGIYDEEAKLIHVPAVDPSQVRVQGRPLQRGGHRVTRPIRLAQSEPMTFDVGALKTAVRLINDAAKQHGVVLSIESNQVRALLELA